MSTLDPTLRLKSIILVIHRRLLLTRMGSEIYRSSNLKLLGRVYESSPFPTSSNGSSIPQRNVLLARLPLHY